MSATVSYKGNTLTTVNNQTRVLNTSGKWLEDNITIVDVTQSGGGTPAISVVDTLDAKGGTVRTITALDISDTTATASDVAVGKYFYTSSGIKTAGSNSGGGGTPSATAHTIYFEFTDGTNASIVAYYDNAFVGSAITATKPVTYNNKTVTLAQLDGVTWYEPINIPIGVELVDYTKVTNNTAIDDDGNTYEQEWCYTSDYIAVDPSMTFSYTAYYWFYIGIYDSSHNVIRTILVQTDSTQDSNNGNLGHGTLSGNKLIGASYIRLCGPYVNSENMSLIRTA